VPNAHIPSAFKCLTRLMLIKRLSKYTLWPRFFGRCWTSRPVERLCIWTPRTLTSVSLCIIYQNLLLLALALCCYQLYENNAWDFQIGLHSWHLQLLVFVFLGTNTSYMRDILQFPSWLIYQETVQFRCY
jgi:hypothetical protein